MVETTPLLYRPEDAAALLSTSRTRVYELIGSGQLRSVKIGRTRLVSRAALEAFIEALAADQGPDAAA